MERYIFSLKYVDRILQKHNYTKVSEGNTDKDKDEKQCSIYFKANLIVQVFFNAYLIGHEVTNISIVDNNFSLPDMYRRFLVTSQDKSVLFKYDSIPLEKMLELAVGDTSTINMRIENYITEKALERL